MAVDIKQVSRGILEEAFGKGNLRYLDQNCDPSFKGHDPLSGEFDLGGFKRMVESYRATFSDLQCAIVGLCAEGDTVCSHWRITATHEKPFMGAAPTGKKLTVEGISFDRFRNGKLAESTTQWDALGLLQSVGLVPKLEVRPPAGAAEQRPHM